VNPRLLVVTTVHPPDDPRIRHKLIETLRPEWEITYAVRDPGPVETAGLSVRRLRGGRLRRDLAAGWLLLRGGYDAAVIHDPELLPAALLARLFRRTVVFDLHEDLPARLQDRGPLPGWLRPAGARLAGWMLRLAERLLPITLAEEGYRRLLARTHPVFPNAPHGDLPEPRDPDPAIGCIYLGDVTPDRGLDVVVTALGTLPQPRPRFTIAGRCSNEYRAHLQNAAAEAGLDLQLLGYLPHPGILATVAGSAVAVSPLLDRANYRNSTPTKMLEYLRVGVPVVASDLPGTREVAGNLPGVRLVPPGDVGAWSEALAEVAESPEWREQARRAAPLVAQRHRWPTDEVRSFYTGLLG
jgi:glycosyltransferase involved in cell wall biosynthesis